MQHARLQKLTIAIIHPCEIIKQGIGAVLKQNGVKEVLLFDNCESFIKRHDFSKIDLLLVHYSQCKSEEKLKEVIAREGFHVALLASSDSFHKDSFHDVMNRMMAGYNGFLDMDEPVYTFLSELINAADGGIVISKKFAYNITHKADLVEGNLSGILSQRELEVLEHVANGSTNIEIGQYLHISPHTVKGHLSNILTKLNLKNRQQAVACIMRRRLLSD